MNLHQELHQESPAKINVFLEVLGKRPDGFHELETVMLRTSLCDSLSFHRSNSGGTTLELKDDSSEGFDGQFPLDHSNLIIQAADALAQYAKCRSGVHVRVTKRIPAEAGLAGGSSNAATTLIALNRLWNLGFTRTQLHHVAATLGSDVNFFVEDCAAAVCRGRGEIVTPIDCEPDLLFVVACPEAGNSTPQVFANVQLPQRCRSSKPLVQALASGMSDKVEAQTFNRLTAAAEIGNPSMSSLLRTLQAVSDRPAFMSGSGSTCFTYAPDKDEADRVVSQLTSESCRRSFVLRCR